MSAYLPHPRPLPDFKEGSEDTSPLTPLHFVERGEKHRIVFLHILGFQEGAK